MTPFPSLSSARFQCNAFLLQFAMKTMRYLQAMLYA
jgi:hypothetical protein